MKKLKLNLNLNKQVVSKLNEKKIVGGRVMCSTWSDLVCFITEREGCQNTAGGPSICGGME